jgi:hypothetical protein
MTSSAALGSFVPSEVRLICRLAGVAAITCGVLLVGAIVVVLARGLQADITSGGLGRIGNNWLLTLFRLHFGVDGFSNGMLHGVRLMDALILALTAIVSVGLWLLLKSTSMVWSVVGMALPVLGIILYVVTQLAGRSAVMGAVLAFSLIALWSPALGQLVAYVGIFAGSLLLLGDFTEPLHSKPIALLIGVGYVLLIVWFVLVGIRLLQAK